MLGGFLSSLCSSAGGNVRRRGNGGHIRAAARVPIAALVMVTEMTGGYRLLPPAAFAVLLSYLVQTQLSAHLKYNSLYEAQVPGRAQSPSRYVENVQLALKLLGSRKIPRAARIGHLDLVALLDSGIPVTLPGRKELAVGVLPSQSIPGGKDGARVLRGGWEGRPGNRGDPAGWRDDPCRSGDGVPGKRSHSHCWFHEGPGPHRRAFCSAGIRRERRILSIEPILRAKVAESIPPRREPPIARGPVHASSGRPGHTHKFPSPGCCSQPQ